MFAGLYTGPRPTWNLRACRNWDSFKPQPVYDTDTGKCIGILMPRITQEVAAATPGLQGWSVPEFETRTPGE